MSTNENTWMEILFPEVQSHKFFKSDFTVLCSIQQVRSTCPSVKNKLSTFYLERSHNNLSSNIKHAWRFILKATNKTSLTSQPIRSHPMELEVKTDRGTHIKSHGKLRTRKLLTNAKKKTAAKRFSPLEWRNAYPYYNNNTRNNRVSICFKHKSAKNLTWTETLIYYAMSIYPGGGCMRCTI